MSSCTYQILIESTHSEHIYDGQNRHIFVLTCCQFYICFSIAFLIKIYALLNEDMKFVYTEWQPL